ncbi:MAG: YebC/PmpR family DNA-binding transcriptional regulator [bacterium]|nr:YebC/PmpR family DNA-binding transcriptional regulator [bacterium]
MSGHSHAKTVKHQKDITAAKKGKIFSKLARQIFIAVKERGGDPNANSTLRMTIEKAREFNMPKENIERAIKKGTGELAGGEVLENIIVEAYGPGGAALIIEGITDNRNRSLGEIKQIIGQFNGKMATEGSVRWLFQRKGYLEIQLAAPEENKREELEILVIEAGAEDFLWRENTLEIYTKPDELEKIKRLLEEKGIKIETASLDWVPKEEIVINDSDKNSCQKLFEALDENDSVQEIYCNTKLS